MRTYQRKEKQATNKRRPGRRTHVTENHRCWVCDNHDKWVAELEEQPDSYFLKAAVNFKCSYQARLNKMQVLTDSSQT